MLLSTAFDSLYHLNATTKKRVSLKRRVLLDSQDEGHQVNQALHDQTRKELANAPIRGYKLTQKVN